MSASNEQHSEQTPSPPTPTTPPPPAEFGATVLPGAVDVSDLLQQMSKTFNSDLDGRTTGGDRAHGSASAALDTARSDGFAAGAAAAATTNSDQTRKWRGLLKNKFAATASRRGGGRAKDRRTQRRRKPTATMSAKATDSVDLGDASTAAAVDIDSESKTNVDAYADATHTNDDDQDQDDAHPQQQQQSMRVLRRHAAVPAIASVPAKRQARARSGRQSVAADVVATVGVVEPAADGPMLEATAAAAAVPIVRRKGRPRRNPLSGVDPVVVASDEPASVNADPCPFEPKKLRSHRTVGAVAAEPRREDAPVINAMGANIAPSAGAAMELVNRSETEAKEEVVLDCKPPSSSCVEKKEEGGAHEDVEKIKVIVDERAQHVDVDDDNKDGCVLMQAVLDKSRTDEVKDVREAAAFVMPLSDGGDADGEIMTADDVKLEEVPAAMVVDVVPEGRWLVFLVHILIRNMLNSS